MKEKFNFSILNRDRHIHKLQTEIFDLAIIGGGITGAGIALDAAARGLHVCLVEKNDFASGTSNKSTKLIHGGLRYLKQFEIGLVRESGSERAIVHKLAPHLVIPEKMLLPLVEGGTYGKMMTSIGLKVYDFLADVKGEDQRKMLNKDETLAKEPLLDEDTVLGGGYYAEYRTDDARLTIEILKKATSYGATIVNYCEMQSFDYDENSKIKSLNCIDYNTEKTFKIKARTYVSAAGPWVDTLRTKDSSMNHKYLHLTKGVHIVFPIEKLPVKQPIYFDVADGRMIFAIPRGRATYVGTTDTNYSGNLDRVVATKEDATYILNAINATFHKLNLNIEDIESNWAGLRPLIHEEDKDPSELSRKDEIFLSDSGLISIAGGKLTGYRKMAMRVIEEVLKKLDVSINDSDTSKIPLVTPPFKDFKNVKIYQEKLRGILAKLDVSDAYHAWYFCTTYGQQSEVIIEKSKFFDNENILERLLRAELWYCVHYEMTNNMTDFFVRRTGRLYFNVQSVLKYKNIVLYDCMNYFNWQKERLQQEQQTIDMLIADATNFYDKEFN